MPARGLRAAAKGSRLEGVKARILLYDERTAATLDAGAVAAWLRETLGAEPEVRPEYVGYCLGAAGEEERQGLARALAAIKVRDFARAEAFAEPIAGEVRFEERRLANANRGPHGIVYEGLRFQALMRGFLRRGEARLDRVQVIFTNRLLATWNRDDLRYHLRTVIAGAPGIVSTTGLVEAPAKPKEFYQAQQQLGRLAQDDATYQALKQRLGGRFLDHDDPRLTEVAKGYLMQVVIYALTGEAFCDDPHCRLYDAHWQEDMLRAQLGQLEFCSRHRRIIRRVKGEE